MSDLFGNHIVGFPTRWLNCLLLHLSVVGTCILHERKKTCSLTMANAVCLLSVCLKVTDPSDPN